MADGDEWLFVRFDEGYYGCLGLAPRATSQGSSVGAPANYVEEDRPRVECRLFFNKPHNNYIYIG